MALIKSALELALERTKDIQGDKTSLEARQYREEGMKLAARVDNEPGFDLAAAMAVHKGQHLVWVKEGMAGIMRSCLGLPASDAQVDRLVRLKPLFLTVAGNRSAMDGILNQLEGYYRQYLQQRLQMIQALSAQLEPKLRQKEEALYQQTGRRVRLTLESDPEFSKYLSGNLDKLNAQYDQALAEVHQEIMSLAGIPAETP